MRTKLQIPYGKKNKKYKNKYKTTLQNSNSRHSPPRDSHYIPVVRREPLF